ncbi:hypothetical protein AMECASPLE_018503 [Ameca splendens]|uniref:Uncharacterized protein n=1 Tax=Ameca splendens TaxID=208324 RepID=A0ABV0ZCS2_9TELE
MKNRLWTESTRGLLGNKTSVGFYLRWSVGRVFDRYMNLLTFLCQTEFQLLSSSWNGHLKKFACLSRNVPLLRRPVRHAGNGNERLFSVDFIILGDVRAATSIELRMSNYVAQSVYRSKWMTPTD